MQQRAIGDGILHQLSFSLGLCRTKRVLRSLGTLLCALCALDGRRCARGESAIGIIPDAKPEMRILWLRVASVACKITKLDREEGRATHRDEVASPSLLTYHLRDAWQGDTQNRWPSQWAHRPYPKSYMGETGARVEERMVYVVGLRLDLDAWCLGPCWGRSWIIT